MNVLTPNDQGSREFTSAGDAVDYLEELYAQATKFLCDRFRSFLKGQGASGRIRAYYPEIRIHVTSHVRVDSRLSFGHTSFPGLFSCTITRPTLFRDYLIRQIELLIESHEVPVQIGPSATPIPIHFALPIGSDSFGDVDNDRLALLRDYFDVPGLDIMHDAIIDGEDWRYEDGSKPLSLFTAQRVDYSLARLAHYTATDLEHFQNHVLFTNYQFYVDEFARFAHGMIGDANSGYSQFVGPGNHIITASGESGTPPASLPQMPAYHLVRENHSGITLVNIGVGPSNAKTITDHIAVLRPHIWLMVGHCAGLRNSQRLGDYVLAHAYMREDHVLDDALPTWVPLPALAEVQKALEASVAEITGLAEYELKRVMRTGTVASVADRNWELNDMSGPVQRLHQARAIALDMESATVAANGFRFRIPYGTLLCVSDKPLHGELKLPGMASDFYRSQVLQHLLIGIRALESLRDMPLAQLHSRKLRTFRETAFL